MKTQYRAITVAAISLVMMGTAALTAAPLGTCGRQAAGPRGRGMGPRDGQRGMLAAIRGQLDLTDEQAEKIQDIVAETRPDAQATREALTEAREAFHDAVADNAEEGQIRAAAETLAKAMADQAILHNKTLASVKEVLTAEQREQLEDLDRPGRFQGERSARPGFPGPMQRGERGDRGPRMGRDDDRGPARGRCERWSRQDSGWDRADRGPERFRRWGGPRWAEETRQRGFRHEPARNVRQGRGPRPLERLFERADTNDDEILDREELEAFRGPRADVRERQPW